MSDILDFSFFESRLNESFQVGAGSISLKLLQCIPLQAHGATTRQPFSLTFQGPKEPLLAQKMYSLHNERTAAMEIFLVPVGRDAAGISYEAVFN